MAAANLLGRRPVGMADHGYSPFEPRDVEEWISRPDLVREAIGDPSRIPDAFWTDLRRGAHWRPSLRRGPGRRFWLQTATAPLACAVLPSGKWHRGFYQAAEGHRADLGSSAGLPAPPPPLPAARPSGRAPVGFRPPDSAQPLAEPVRTQWARRAATEAPGFLLRALEAEPRIARSVSPEVWATLLNADVRSVRERALACLPRRVE